MAPAAAQCRGAVVRAGAGALLVAREAVAGYVCSGLRPALQIELGEDRADVVLDRLVGEEDLGRDLLVRLPLRDEQEDLTLLRGQFGELVPVRPAGDDPDALEDLLGHGRVEERLSPPDGLEGGDQVASADLLEQVATRAGDDRGEDRLLVGVAREHEDADCWVLGPDLARRLDARAVRQANIHDDEIGPMRAGRLDRLRGGPDLGDDREGWTPFEQRDEPPSNDLVVIHDEEPENRGGLRLDQGWHLS